MAVAGLADRLQIAVRRHDQPIRPDDRLHDHGGDRLRVLVLEDLLKVRRARADRARVGMTGRAAVRVGVEHADDAGDAGLGRPAPRIAGQRDRAACRPVVGAVARDHLVAARVPARELDRVLVRLRAAVREEGHAQVPRGDLGDEPRKLAALVVGDRRPDRAEAVGLLLDRRDHLWMLVADVQVHELRGEVEVALPVVVPEPDPLAAGDRQRLDLRLDRPRMEDVLAVVLPHLFGLGRLSLDDRHDYPMVTGRGTLSQSRRGGAT